MAEPTPSLPIAISSIDGKYLLFDIDAISWLRRNHNICGVFAGTLPQNPQQNLFMGLPLQIMIEEAQLLLDLGIAYILDDAKAHDVAMAMLNKDNRRQYLSELNNQVSEISAAKARSKEIDKKKALKKVKEKTNRAREQHADQILEAESTPTAVDPDDSLFSPTPTASVSTHEISSKSPLVSITPASSVSLLDSSAGSEKVVTYLPNLPFSSYNLYRHLHQSRTFFHTPGLRFGSQFSVYPGDPLRFHAHFLAVGVDWEQELDLMDIVGGGRLGTGVKKGFLLGGREPADESSTTLDSDLNGAHGKMRCFSIEWAVM